MLAFSRTRMYGIDYLVNTVVHTIDKRVQTFRQCETSSSWSRGGSVGLFCLRAFLESLDGLSLFADHVAARGVGVVGCCCP